MKKFTRISIALFALVVLVQFVSCDKDERIKPGLEFKSDAGYVTGDVTLDSNATFKIGVVATKTEDELKTYNVSRGYDGANPSTLKNETLSGSDQDGFTKEETFTTRNRKGSERYEFTVTDRDGNITTKGLTVTVK